MLSGIGPKLHLEELGIKCIADLPVGQNLQDHIGIQMKATTNPGCGVITHEALQKNENNIRTSNMLESTAFIQTPLKEPDINWPEIQVKFMPTFYPYGLDEPELHDLNSSKFSPLMGYDTPKEVRMRKEGVTFIPTLLHPKSKGEVRLRNTNPPLHQLSIHIIYKVRMTSKF
ncbi:ecdysone oxidase-like [Amphiura filiformis]|uniref:ecdysone oxidase-like n=1 Tax=Amphiura filiformis TaxID=82378 RepID=UPI003B22088B